MKNTNLVTYTKPKISSHLFWDDAHSLVLARTQQQAENGVDFYVDAELLENER